MRDTPDRSVCDCNVHRASAAMDSSCKSPRADAHPAVGARDQGCIADRPIDSTFHADRDRCIKRHDSVAMHVGEHLSACQRKLGDHLLKRGIVHFQLITRRNSEASSPPLFTLPLIVGGHTDTSLASLTGLAASACLHVATI